VFMKRSG